MTKRSRSTAKVFPVPEKAPAPSQTTNSDDEAQVRATGENGLHSPPLGFQDFLGIMRSFTLLESDDGEDDHMSRVHRTICRVQTMLRERLRRIGPLRGAEHRTQHLPASAEMLQAMLKEHGLDTDGASHLWYEFETAQSDLEYNRRNRRAEEIQVLGRSLT
jgi:hypothetical protein